MKKGLMIATFFIVANICAAQKKINFKTDGFSFLKVSVNNASLSSKTTGSSAHTAPTRVGYGIGVERLLQLKETIFLTGQLLLNSRGYKNVRTTYIDVPVAINFLLGKNKLFMLGTGIYGGYAISGRYKTTTGWKKMQWGESLTDNRSRIDAGVVINFAYTFANGYPLLTATYQIGINNVISQQQQTAGNTNRLNMAQLSFGYPLNMFKKIFNPTGKKL
jgi:hypothetical protein